MSHIIIVSNRLPVSVKKENGQLVFYSSLGGLATGLSSYVKNRHNTWIGWPGIASDELTDKDKQAITARLAKDNCSPVFLSQRQIEDYYNGFSNSVLWPLCHNLPLKQTDQAVLSRWWRAYREVNKQFAEAVLGNAGARSRVWVHDYQLMLVPSLLRAENLPGTLGFFMHIPFPAAKSFNKLRQHKRLLLGMAGADLLGFHTPAYVEDFLEACRQAKLGEPEAGQLLVGGRTIRVADFPMGIDFEKYATAAKSKAVKAAIKKYRRRYKGRKLVVSIDRLDPSKGLEERLKAYRLFLEFHPRMRGKLVLSMVVAPSRTDIPAYRNLSRRLDKLVEQINRDFGSAKWQPVDYINSGLPFEEVTALFKLADVAFIAPLRDGMNLAAKEFVASASGRGALILSQTAGAAGELQDALLVDPKQPESMVDALHEALKMRRRELKRRLKSMRRNLAINTVQDWTMDFVGTLQQPVPGAHLTRTLNTKLQSQLLDEYRTAGKRLLLLDYDGSLVPLVGNYRQATPPKSLVKLLEGLCANPKNEVVLVSGRGAGDLQVWFGRLPISLIAEHGAAVRRAGNKSWRTIEKVDNRWKRQLEPALASFAQQTPGARVERKDHSLVWHYRSTTPYQAQKNLVGLKTFIKPLLRKYGLQMMRGNKIIEIKDPAVSKGAAAGPWLTGGHDFIFALGDDITDEELFKVLPPTAYSLRVGRGRTAARYRVAGHKDVLALLRRLAKA